MSSTATFLVMTHPSQLHTQNIQRKVRSFTSKHNRRQKRVKLLKEIPSTPSTPTKIKDEVESDVEEVARDGDDRIANRKLPSLHASLYCGAPAKQPKETNDLYNTWGTPRLDLLEPYRAQRGTGEHVSRLLDYYLTQYGPTYVWRPEMISKGSIESFSQRFFQFSMSHTVVLEVVLSLCQAQLELKALPNSQPSKIVMIHRGKALNALQQKLAQSSTDDSVLISVVGCMTYDLIYEDWASFEQNLKGLRNLVKHRGGVDALGWQGWFAYCVSWTELRWANHLATLPLSSLSSENAPPSIQLTYPTHPYDPQICLLISKLPSGFQDITMVSILSHQVLRFMQSVCSWTTTFTLALTNSDTPTVSTCSLEGLRLAALAARLLAGPALSIHERILCITFLAFVVSFDGTQARHPRGLEDYMAVLPDLVEPIKPSVCPSVAWIALVLASAKDSIAAPLVNRWLLLDIVFDKGLHVDWDTQGKVLVKRYLWNRWLIERWETCWRIGRERWKERQEKKETDLERDLLSTR